jgi:hypothetical protein
MAGRSKDAEKAPSMKGVIELLLRSTTDKYNRLDSDPSKKIDLEIIERNIPLRFHGTVQDFCVTESPMVRTLAALITRDELQSFVSTNAPKDPEAYIVDAKITDTRCNLPDQDFRFATSFTRGCLQYIEFTSPGSLSPDIYHTVFQTKKPVYSVYVPASEGGDRISEHYQGKTMKPPVDIPIIQGGATVWHDTVKMYAGVNKVSIENTIKRTKTMGATRADSLIGFVVKSMFTSATFVHDRDVLPINTDVILRAPSSFFNEAITCVSKRVEALARFGKVSIPRIQFFLLSDTLSQDYHRDDETRTLVHKETGVRLPLDQEIEIVLSVNLKFAYPIRKPESTAMCEDTAHVWFQDVWKSSDVNKTTGAIKRGAEPLKGTVADQEREKEKEQREIRENLAKKRAAQDIERGLESVAEQHDSQTDDDEDVSSHPFAASSSDVFVNPLSDD